METWFLAAVTGALLSGIGNFAFKQAAVRGYNSELFSLYGGISSVLLVSIALLISPEPVSLMPALAVVVVATGISSAFYGILKVYALRYIDSTIYFPLFKLLAPLLAIIAGVTLFGESFSSLEWLGMSVGLIVPLMLITRTEDSRQNNLVAGLLLVVVTGVLSAAAAVVYKYAIDGGLGTTVTLWYTAIGILLGSVLVLLYRQGITQMAASISRDSSWGLCLTAAGRSAFVATSVWLMFYAFANGGTLAIVQTIHSMYILIPIVLAIIFYNEHWNLQKAAAIVLSVASLALLG